jgi:hypothetical protein
MSHSRKRSATVAALSDPNSPLSNSIVSPEDVWNRASPLNFAAVGKEDVHANSARKRPRLIIDINVNCNYMETIEESDDDNNDVDRGINAEKEVEVEGDDDHVFDVVDLLSEASSISDELSSIVSDCSNPSMIEEPDEDAEHDKDESEADDDDEEDDIESVYARERAIILGSLALAFEDVTSTSNSDDMNDHAASDEHSTRSPIVSEDVWPIAAAA